jgi:hypothetical protein
MAYDADPDEVFYCGSCRRQQRPGDGEKCRLCGRTTVSWRTNHESEDVARARWKRVNG